MAAKYVKSQRGGDKLAYGGYFYVKQFTNHNCNNTYWKCDKATAVECPGRAVTKGGIVTVTCEHQNHGPSSVQMRRPPKRRRARRLAQNGQNNGEENGGEEEEEGEGEEWEVEEGAEIDSINADDVGIGPDDFNNFDGTTNGGGGGLMVATTSSHFFNDEMKPPMATVTAFEVVHHSNVKEGAEEKMLDAALEWIMADGGALNVLNSAAFQTFFKATCQIQIEQLSRGNKKALALPDVNEIGEAMDRHLAKIECQKRALDEKQSRIMGLRRTLMMEDGENGDGEEQRKREAELS